MLDAQHPLVRAAEAAAGALCRYHRATLAGAEHLPAGPALLVGNHGLFGFETPAFFYLLRQATGRYPLGLADRTVFGWPPLRQLLARVGGIPGTRENARALLAEGELVVCYPGGAREVFKGPDRLYALRWERALGFARVALETGAPIVPFAGLGVDGGYLNLGHLPTAQRLLGRYSVPVAVGLGPLPLPVPFRFRLGPALTARPGEAAEGLKARVQAAVERLLSGTGHEASQPEAQPALV